MCLQMYVSFMEGGTSYASERLLEGSSNTVSSTRTMVEAPPHLAYDRQFTRLDMAQLFSEAQA